MLAALTGLAGLVIARLVYPRWLERRALRARPLGADGVVVGAAPVHLPAPGGQAVLLLHGGGDTPQVVAALARHLHDRGFAVRAPLLSGHGRALAALRHVTAAQLGEDVRREYETMRAEHAWVGIVGLSVGGDLAIALAATRADVPALVLLAPYVEMPRAARLLAATGWLWGAALPYVPSGGRRSIHDPKAAAAALGHGILTAAALRAFRDVVDDVRTQLPRVSAPTLVIQSRQDNRISVRAAETAFQLLGSTEKRLLWTQGAGHVITVDFGFAQVFENTAEWLTRHSGTSETAKDRR